VKASQRATKMKVAFIQKTVIRKDDYLGKEKLCLSVIILHKKARKNKNSDKIKQIKTNERAIIES